MSRYLQTSTGNPYGHRPWATRLYTGFENYGFLKQPQNTIIREDVNMRPEIYRPPEMKAAAGLGSVTLVGGSGRILRRASRRRTMLGAVAPGPAMSLIWRGGVRPITYDPANCAQFASLPPAGCFDSPAPTAAYPCATKRICAPPPFQILPPSMVPPPPQPIVSGPGGIVYALPGDATTPGTPFAPADSSLPPGAVPVSSPAAAAAAAATPPPVSVASLSDWFNAQTWIAGVPNGYVALGGAFAIYLFSKKKR